MYEQCAAYLQMCTAASRRVHEFYTLRLKFAFEYSMSEHEFFRTYIPIQAPGNFVLDFVLWAFVLCIGCYKLCLFGVGNVFGSHFTKRANIYRKAAKQNIAFFNSKCRKSSYYYVLVGNTQSLNSPNALSIRPILSLTHLTFTCDSIFFSHL